MAVMGREFLLNCYDDYFGSLPHADTRDVFAGFGVTMGGVGLLVVGWVLFFWSEYAAEATPWTLRETAIVAAGLGFPALLVGMVLLLTADAYVTQPAIAYASVGGFVLCLVALAGFVAVYPAHWNVARGADYSLPGVTVYGVGLMTMLLATGAAIGCRCAVSTDAPGDVEV